MFFELDNRLNLIYVFCILQSSMLNKKLSKLVNQGRVVIT